MFDAKSLLESLVRGATPPPQSGTQDGGLADILGQVLGGGTSEARGGTNPGDDILSELNRSLQQRGGTSGQNGGGLSDILGQLQKQLGENAPRAAVENPGAQPGSGSLGDILGQLKDQLGKAGGAVTGGQGGGALDVLGQILAQAAQGVKEGATKIDSATGASEVLTKAAGQSPADILAQLQDLVKQNPLAAGTAMGGLGGLVLGTRTGRSIAGSAARVGALALIGGLAYKAFQNYQSGKPLITGATPGERAPDGSGFEPAAASNTAAELYIRSMIAAAAADGRIDNAEQVKIMGALKQAGVDAEAEAFLADAMNNPATPAQLAKSVSSPEEALQLYTAARIAIEPDTAAEQKFLASLAAALGIDAKLSAHIDAVTRSAAA